MKVTVDRDALLRILGRTQGVVDKRHSMTVLTNALLEAVDGNLHVIATDLEVSLRQTIQASTAEPGKAATSARTLFEIVREASGEEITISTMENQWVEVSYGKSNFKLMGIDPGEHPGMPAVPNDGAKAAPVEIGAGDLAEMIRKTIFAVSTDDTRSNLAGVYLDGAGAKKGALRMVATDGHRLAMIDRSTSGAAVGDGVILPRKGLAEVGKLLAEESGNVTLTLTGSEAMIEIGDSLLSMRLVEGAYPDYRKVVPEEITRRVISDRDALLQTLRRVAILSTERARGVKLHLRDGTVQVTANNPDMGEASEELVVDYEGDDLQVGYNAKYLLDVNLSLPIPEIKGAGSPVLRVGTKNKTVAFNVPDLGTFYLDERDFITGVERRKTTSFNRRNITELKSRKPARF